MADVRALSANMLAAAADLGLDQTLALRAMAQDMAWAMLDGEVLRGAATARLADGTLFLDGLVGDAVSKQALIAHAVRYARWSDAPALILRAPREAIALDDLGFVGLDPTGLPPQLHDAAQGKKLLMKRL